ncbi:JAB domain-containing protein [Ligilactobacillus animalis]|uniref:JAB domain-containing protein n=1 Tax=Ligilactobacillus animalis TaxID=1605 RepID=UPI0009F18C34|nr:JAB domain-containing protein [Ligilactobacillus animalis]QHQ70655.1 DNA repair protein RadC [Ligilactobacillus animalis]
MEKEVVKFIRLKQERIKIEGWEQLSASAISTPYDTANLVEPFLKEADREMMLVIGLDTKNKPTVISIISIGTLNQSTVLVREIFKTLLLANSIRFIVVHNHPSGDTTPSENDLKITQKLKKAGEMMEIVLLDSIIYGDDIRSLLANDWGGVSLGRI